MTAIQIIPLLFSCLAIAISYYAATRSYKSALRPYLIFYNREFDPNEETSWVLENAGNGPAVNVKVAGDSGAVISEAADACVIPSIPKGASTRVGWLKKRNILAATYEDVLGNQYTTVCSNNVHQMYEKNMYPGLRGTPIFFALSANRVVVQRNENVTSQPNSDSIETDKHQPISVTGQSTSRQGQIS